MKKLRWWWMFWSMVGGSAIAGAMGGFQFLWNADQTKITFIMLAIFWALTVFIGWLTTRKPGSWKDLTQSKWQKLVDACWFGSDALMRLGIVTTVTGFILMFHGAIGHLDISNIENVKALVVSISSGLTTALVGTLVGIVTSLLTGLQLINLEQDE